jgi:hypothetical protein
MPKKVMPKQAISLRHVAIAAIAAAALSLPAISSAQAEDGYPNRFDSQSGAARCKVIGSISHRCLNFNSDATYPEGLSDYFGSNGG